MKNTHILNLAFQVLLGSVVLGAGILACTPPQVLLDESYAAAIADAETAQANESYRAFR